MVFSVNNTRSAPTSSLDDKRNRLDELMGKRDAALENERKAEGILFIVKILRGVLNTLGTSAGVAAANALSASIQALTTLAHSLSETV